MAEYKNSLKLAGKELQEAYRIKNTNKNTLNIVPWRNVDKRLTELAVLYISTPADKCTVSPKRLIFNNLITTALMVGKGRNY